MKRFCQSQPTGALRPVFIEANRHDRAIGLDGMTDALAESLQEPRSGTEKRAPQRIGDAPLDPQRLEAMGAGERFQKGADGLLAAHRAGSSEKKAHG